jgi:hypothetical protein
MKTTLVAIYIGFTIRLLVCGSILPSTCVDKSRIAQATPADSVAIIHHGKSVSFREE